MGKKNDIYYFFLFFQKRWKILDCINFEEKWLLGTLSPHLPNKQAFPSI